jgi:acyl dehydratase
MSAPATLALRHGPVSAVDLALFAAASGDHNPLHLDEDVARAAGFERPLVHGMLTMAVAGRLFTQAFGPGSVLALHTRFTGASLRGETLHLAAALERTQDGGIAHYALSVRNDRDAEVATGHARVRTGACGDTHEHTRDHTHDDVHAGARPDGHTGAREDAAP